MKDSILTDDLKVKHQVFTPEKIVKKMINIADKSANKKIYNCCILENSCGNGNVLTMIVEKFIDEAILDNIEIRQIKVLLQKNIHAYEIDKQLLNDCKKRLNTICKKHQIKNIKWDIKNIDFLKDDSETLYDIIIGNPPYISYLDMPIDKRELLRNNFNSCSIGKFDYSYAFIEKSYNLLNGNGSLIYLVPSNWFKNVSAKALRSLLIDDLNEIIDFQKQRIFSDVLVSTSIVHIIKGCNKQHFKYRCKSKNISKTINKDIIEDKWIFKKTVDHKIVFQENFDVFVTIATLSNNIFVLSNGQVEGRYFLYKNHRIELEILKPAYSPKDKKYNCNNKRIIFPYKFKNGVLVHYTEEELQQLFPCAFEYLKENETKLSERDSDSNAKWFEYGRSQAISHMNKEMCIISSIISDETKAYVIETDEIPYSGICIVPKNNNTVQDILDIINTTEFRNYAQTIGVSVNGNSKRISPNDIKKYSYVRG